MALTRPTFQNLNSNLTTFTDALTVINFGNVANRDIGEVFDRSQGGGSNVAIIWNESNQGFRLIYTSDTGKGVGNVAITGNANLTVGNLTVVGSMGNPSAAVFTATTSFNGPLNGTLGAAGGNTAIVSSLSATGNATVSGLAVNNSATFGSTVGVTGALTIDGGVYGNVVTTQFASLYATAVGSNAYSIVQVRSNDGTTGMGMRAYAGLNGQIYSNSGITFTTGATLKDKDFPTGGTTRATFDSSGLAVTGVITTTGNIIGAGVTSNGSITAITTASALGGIQNTPIGNVTPSTAIFTSESVSGNSTVNGLTVNASATIGSTLGVTGNLIVTGTTTFTGNILGNTNYSANVIAAGFFFANGTAVGTGGGANISTTTNPSLYNGTATNVTTATTLIDSISITGNTTITYTISAIDNTNSRFKTSKVDTVNDGTNVYYNEYAVVRSNTNFNVAVITSNISGGQLRMYAQGDSANTTVSFQRVVLGSVTSAGYINAGATGATGNTSPPGGANTYVQFNDNSTLSGNAQFVYNKTTNTLTVGGISVSSTVQPNANASVGLGSTSTYWGSGYIATLNAPSITGVLQTAAQPNITSVGTLTGLTLSGTLNGTTVQAATIGNSGATLTGTLNTAAQTGITSVGTLTGLTLSGAANFNANINTNNIMPYGNANANIGSSSLQYNTIFAKATSAQYADLAENYLADADYVPGTVVVFGGPKEVTQSITLADNRIAGVVSTNPAYLMNGGLNNSVAVALLGRVPCKVVGTIRRGDMLVSSSVPGVATYMGTPQIGTVIGKALEDYDNSGVGVIEVVVGRL